MRKPHDETNLQSEPGEMAPLEGEAADPDRELEELLFVNPADPDDTEAAAQAEVNRDVSADLRRILAPLGADDLDDESSQAASAAPENPDSVRARFEQVEREIIARAPEHQVQPSLERMALAMHLLGDPQCSYRSVHITGTNGKTSTARMISALLSASGRKVGRFTSPHLVTSRERISVDEEPISPARYLDAFNDVAAYIDLVDAHSARDGKPRMSFFEVLTTMALAAFADIPVDAAVIEVGMGGRWDATNVVDAEVAVITPIGLDHERWLGATLREIATEKAGIIKAGATVICAEQDAEVMEIIAERAREVGAQLRTLGRDIVLTNRSMGVGGQLVTITTPAATYTDVVVPLLGEHQCHNAALALAAMEAFNGGRALEARIVSDGFAMASSPGRLEVVRSSPSIVIDAAHNPHGAAALAQALEESFDYTTIVGVYAAMADKNVEAVLAEMEPVLAEIVITSMHSPRAMDTDELADVAREVFGEDRVFVEPALLDAIDKAVERSEIKGDPAASSGVVVFGSVVLVGETRKLIKGQEG